VNNPGVQTAFFLGNANLEFYLASDGTLVPQSIGGWVSSGFLSTSPNDVVFSGVYALTGPATNNLGVQFQLYANCGEGASCDYSHTGAVGLDLPGNVTFTSASGVFLTQTTPEPASAWLIVSGLAGLAGLGAIRRLRRSARLS